VGAGAGVPGLVFAVLRPDLHVALIEADRRRVGFLVHVAGVLGVRNARMVAERAEDAGHRVGPLTMRLVRLAPAGLVPLDQD